MISFFLFNYVYGIFVGSGLFFYILCAFYLNYAYIELIQGAVRNGRGERNGGNNFKEKKRVLIDSGLSEKGSRIHSLLSQKG